MSGHSGDLWFVKKVMKQIVRRHFDEIFMGRLIKKRHVHQTMSWLHRMGKRETLDLMKIVMQTYPGIKYNNRGLWIPADYLKPEHGFVAPADNPPK